jgi:hypothetical protein
MAWKNQNRREGGAAQDGCEEWMQVVAGVEVGHYH